MPPRLGDAFRFVRIKWVNDSPLLINQIFWKWDTGNHFNQTSTRCPKSDGQIFELNKRSSIVVRWLVSKFSPADANSAGAYFRIDYNGEKANSTANFLVQFKFDFLNVQNPEITLKITNEYKEPLRLFIRPSQNVGDWWKIGPFRAISDKDFNDQTLIPVPDWAAPR